MNVGFWRSGSTSCDSSVSTRLAHVPSPGSSSARQDVDAGLLLDRVAERDPLPRAREVDRAVVADLVRDVLDQLLEPVRDVVVVRVRLVPLDHRELGVVLVRHALVAEVLADLVDALEPADDQPLQVQLVGDPQEEVAVELVVMGHERPRQRASVERLEDRGLDLEEAAVVEPVANRADDLGAAG